MQSRKFAAICSVILASLSLTVTQGERGSAFNKMFPSVEAHRKVLPSHSSNLQNYLTAQAVNLTGRWRCDDGGIYYIRQVDNEIFWFGESSDKISWTNVYHGYISGDSITGSWADVPKANIRQAGEMDIRIESPRRIVATRKTGNFGGGVWTR